MRTKPIARVMRNRALSALAGTAQVSQEYAELPEADTHCFDDDTRTSVWSYSAERMRAFADATYALRALKSSAAPAQPGQEGKP